MNVYIETNYVLELVLHQEQFASCEQILLLAECGKLSLLLPAYSLLEPLEKLGRQRQDRLTFRIASCFLNTNSRDFATFDIKSELATLDCRLISQFDDGLSFIEAKLAL